MRGKNAFYSISFVQRIGFSFFFYKHVASGSFDIQSTGIKSDTTIEPSIVEGEIRGAVFFLFCHVLGRYFLKS